METGQKGGFGLPCVLIFLKFFYFFHEIFSIPFDLIPYRPAGTVYFVTDTLTVVKRFVFLSLVTDTLIALQSSDSKTFYTIRHEEYRFIVIRNGRTYRPNQHCFTTTCHVHAYRYKWIRFANIVVVSFTLAFYKYQ